MLYQDLPRHERHPVDSVITLISNNMAQIEESMGGNLSNFHRDMSLFIAGIVVALLFNTVIIEFHAYSIADSLSAKVLSMVHIAFAFGGEDNASDNELDIVLKDTVKYNVGVDMQNTIYDKIEKAERAANVYDFICSMPQMYDTGIGEGGVSLFIGSTLIAHCLTMVKNADRIIVMDRGRVQSLLT
ncbi:unnamed protein product [Hymenolepis diminuta]|uniref:Uncharacterized protein n=1 Tax=Hymenolepis diminuta TaxID=6216 RepID=A0A3P6ZK59_HYMDI|nr:unnamed protein product [Hymenolepis diminuta]